MHADVTELREQLPAKENEVLCSLLAHLMASHATYVLATMQCPRQHRPTSLQLIGQHHPCPLAKRLQHGNARCTRNLKRRIAPISASASFPNAVMSPDQVRNLLMGAGSLSLQLLLYHGHLVNAIQGCMLPVISSCYSDHLPRGEPGWREHTARLDIKLMCNHRPAHRSCGCCTRVCRRRRRRLPRWSTFPAPMAPGRPSRRR